MISYWPEFLLVATAHLIAVASPGPDFALVLRQSIAHGRRTAVWTSFGIGTGILLHVSYSLLGLALLIKGSVLWFMAVKYAGAGYLAWLGIKGLLSRPTRADATTVAGATPQSTHGAFLTGFLVNALNPKAALFFIALFSVVVHPGTPRGVQIFYGAWMSVMTVVWFVFVSFCCTQQRVRLAFLRAGPWFDRAIGLVLLALAVRLAFYTFTG